MDGETLALADDFAPAGQEAWLALAARTMKGAPFETLQSRTADGIVVEPLYAPTAAPCPARAPPAVDASRPWDVRAIVEHADPALANAEALEDLGNGAASILLVLDARALGGGAGVAVAAGEDLARVLEGVLLDVAPVALDAGFMGPRAAEWLSELAKGGPAVPLALHLDPIGAFARAGRSPGPAEAHVARSAATGARLAATYPRASLFLASGRVVHEAGGSEGRELGFAAACALAYARALEAAGMARDAAFARIVIGLSADVDVFTTLAKLRAARLIWAKLTAACGVVAPAAIEARSSRRMLTRLDAWTNLPRLTSAAFAAAAGGADAVALEPFTAALGGASAAGRRQARNIQLVLLEEAHLGRVADPAGGAGYVEALTEALARAGWTELRAIEREGGALAALTRGRLAAEVARVREAARQAYAEDRRGLVGVTRFCDRADAPPGVEAAPADVAPLAPDLVHSVAQPGPDGVCAPLTPIRWAEPFEWPFGGAADGR